MSNISRDELLSRLDDPSLVIVDVLARDSWERHHIRGALSIPIDELEARAPAELPDRDREIVVYCGSAT